MKRLACLIIFLLQIFIVFDMAADGIDIDLYENTDYTTTVFYKNNDAVDVITTTSEAAIGNDVIICIYKDGRLINLHSFENIEAEGMFVCSESCEFDMVKVLVWESIDSLKNVCLIQNKGDVCVNSDNEEEHVVVVDENFIMPDCDTDGIMGDRHCLKCGKRFEEKMLASAGHSYVDFVCKVCGKRDVVSAGDIVCWGDSLTYGTGADDIKSQSYPDMLEKLTGKTVHKCGYPGDTSAEIAGYQGALPLMVEPCTIPNKGSVEVTIYDYMRSNDTPFRFPKISAATGINPVTINGVEGTLDLSISSNTNNRKFTFTRTTEGEEVTLNAPTPIVTDVGEMYKDNTAVIFMGTNGGYKGDINVLIWQIKKMIEKQSAEEKKYIVIGFIHGTIGGYKNIDKAMTDAFGVNYINMREYLVENGLSDNNLKASAADLVDVISGRVPETLKSDDIHLNAYGYKAMANRVYSKGKELGYW